MGLPEKEIKLERNLGVEILPGALEQVRHEVLRKGKSLMAEHRSIETS